MQKSPNFDGQSSIWLLTVIRSITDFVVEHWLARYMLDTKKGIHVSQSSKESVRREITILQCIKCSDKSHIPYELQYQDQPNYEALLH